MKSLHKSKNLLFYTTASIALFLAMYMLFLFIIRDKHPYSWRKYTSEKYMISFYYPSDLLITVCSQGGFILAKENLETCQFPEENPSYQEKLFLQMYPENSALIEVNEPNTTSSEVNLSEYYLSCYDGRDTFFDYRPSYKMWLKTVPHKPESPITKLKTSQGEITTHGLASQGRLNKDPCFGFTEKSLRLKEIEMVLDSVKLQ